MSDSVVVVIYISHGMMGSMLGTPWYSYIPVQLSIYSSYSSSRSSSVV